MAENIDGTNPLSSGGHVWLWGPRQRVTKTLGTAGVLGSASILTHAGGRPLTIGGRNGGPALLKVSGASTSVCDAALTVLEAVLEALCDSGASVAWQDDHGNSGTGLVVLSYQRQGHREYAAGGTAAWQRYTLSAVDLSGNGS